MSLQDREYWKNRHREQQQIGRINRLTLHWTRLRILYYNRTANRLVFLALGIGLGVWCADPIRRAIAQLIAIVR